MDYLSKLSYITGVTCTGFLLGFLPSITLAQNNDNNFELPAIQQPKNKDKKVAMEPVIESLPQEDTNEDGNTPSATGSVETGSIDTEETALYNIPHIDQKRVEAAWLDMINEVRSEQAWDYTLDTELVKTSIQWADTLAAERRFKNMHKRPGQSCSGARCYDSKAMSKWFATQGINDRTVSESIGYGWYSCKKDDCTDALITATKKTFKFFMSEAKRNGPHYKMVVSGKYSKVGFGIAQTKASRGSAYVFVMHVSN